VAPHLTPVCSGRSKAGFEVSCR